MHWEKIATRFCSGERRRSCRFRHINCLVVQIGEGTLPGHVVHGGRLLHGGTWREATRERKMPHGRFSEHQSMWIAYQLLLALDHMHHLCPPVVVHRDIKHQNILLSSDDP